MKHLVIIKNALVLSVTILTLASNVGAAEKLTKKNSASEKTKDSKRVANKKLSQKNKSERVKVASPEKRTLKNAPFAYQLQTENFQVSSGECDVEQFQLAYYLLDEKYLGNKELDSKARISWISAFFKTTSLSCLKKFGVVQFIKGCMYSSEQDEVTGEIKKYLNRSRDLRGRNQLFVHKNWEADTTDIDPLYWSAERDAKVGEDRNSVRIEKYLHPTVDLKIEDHEVEMLNILNYLENEKNMERIEKSSPTRPQLFVTDMPTGTSADEKSATNSSLRFQTCLYDLKNVPMTGSPKGPMFSREEGGPIKCLNWDHNQVYNFETKTFESPEGFDPICGIESEDKYE